MTDHKITKEEATFILKVLNSGPEAVMVDDAPTVSVAKHLIDQWGIMVPDIHDFDNIHDFTREYVKLLECGPYFNTGLDSTQEAVMAAWDVIEGWTEEEINNLADELWGRK